MQTGYAAPYEVSPGLINTQSAQCQSAITWCFLGFEAFIVPLIPTKQKLKDMQSLSFHYACYVEYIKTYSPK
ncbi:MAG: hypothetical protein L6V88_07335 [Anaerotruncus sp.]|nr:MAG: hypothetical protein L6V88_07335 [Anaerotruncus sp.]